MIERVISGGQTGADQGGLRAARACGIETSGWAPRGWKTEDGPAPWLAEWGLVEHTSAAYPPRTAVNVRDSEVTLWFGTNDSRGFGCTLSACHRLHRPFFRVDPWMPPSEVVTYLNRYGFKTINIAGNRESSNPGIGARVEQFLVAVFREMRGVEP